MKVTVVPAQVTTVEDHVAGSLGFSQLILFAIPVFGGALLYAILPPSMEYCLYKIIVIAFLAVLSCIMAGVRGIEPRFQVLETRVLAVVLYPYSVILYLVILTDNYEEVQ